MPTVSISMDNVDDLKIAEDLLQQFADGAEGSVIAGGGAGCALTAEISQENAGRVSNAVRAINAQIDEHIPTFRCTIN